MPPVSVAPAFPGDAATAEFFAADCCAGALTATSAVAMFCAAVSPGTMTGGVSGCCDGDRKARSSLAREFRLSDVIGLINFDARKTTLIAAFGSRV